MSAIDKYLKQLETAFANTGKAGDLVGIGRSTYDAVGKYLTSRNMIKRGAYEQMTVSNESMSFETAMNAQGVDGLKDLVESCGVPQAYVKDCCKTILNIMNRCSQGAAAAWQQQNLRADHTANGQAEARPLSSIYSSDVAGILNSTAVAGQEAFGTNVDMAVPDMKVAITVAIMDFHVRLIPRVMPTRSTTQPNVSYTKEWLEVYDLTGNTKDSQRLVDLYADPSFARNELKLIEVNPANDPEQKFINGDGTLKFGPKANILELSTREDKYGYSHINRTDLIADNVQIKFVRVALTFNGGEAEYFDCEVPISKNRLTRMVNANDSAMRNADIKFRTYLRKGAMMANGSASGILSNLSDSEAFVLDFNVKPSISLKWGIADCLADVSVSVRHDIDNAQLSGFATSLMSSGALSLIGYELDARFSEENLRKTSIAVMTHRVPFSFDIPIGRNYVFDYAIGQVNAEENATNLTKVIGLGQDKVALELGIRTIEDVYDRIRAVSPNPVDRPEYVGTNYVAGDKVRPSIFIGDLDLTNLETIRDADRAGDIKQKAISMLTAATSRILQESFLQQQLGGSTTATFKGITSIEILGNVIGMPHIHDHMSKDDGRNVGDGVEYVLVLPNGVKIEFVTSTFDSMRDKIVMWPTIPNNTESELHFAHNWDYGCMVAHYTPSGEAAHHRLFGNIRELPIVVNPLGLIIQVKGIELANGIALDGVVRPTFNVNVEGSVVTTVNGTITCAPEQGGTEEP